MLKGITFGAFDPLHIGHVFLFQNAKQQCDHLTVVVSSDKYISNVKGYSPKFTYRQRIKALSSIKEIDYIYSQKDENSKKYFVDLLKPDVIFVGSDWTPETFKGEGLGIKVVYLPRTPYISATQLRNEI
jgi:glycerol-3-phosphate cytidylyltransferase